MLSGCCPGGAALLIVGFSHGYQCVNLALLGESLVEVSDHTRIARRRQVVDHCPQPSPSSFSPLGNCVYTGGLVSIEGFSFDLLW